MNSQAIPSSRHRWLKRGVMVILTALVMLETLIVIFGSGPSWDQASGLTQWLTAILVSIFLFYTASRLSREGSPTTGIWAWLAVSGLLLSFSTSIKILYPGATLGSGPHPIAIILDCLFYLAFGAALYAARARFHLARWNAELWVDQLILLLLILTVCWNAHLGLFLSNLHQGAATNDQILAVLYSLLDAAGLLYLYHLLQRQAQKSISVLSVALVGLAWLCMQTGDLSLARHHLTGEPALKRLAELCFVLYGYIIAVAAYIRTLPSGRVESWWSPEGLQAFFLFLYSRLWLASVVGLLALSHLTGSAEHLTFNITSIALLIVLMSTRQAVSLRKDWRLTQRLKSSNEELSRTSRELAILNEQIRLRGEERLRSVTDLFHEVFENAPIGMYLCKVIRKDEGREMSFMFETANPALKQMLGLPHSHLGTDLMVHSEQQNVAEVLEVLEKCRRSGLPVEYESQHEHEGVLRITKSLVFPVKTSDGSVSNLIGFVRDTTQSTLTWQALQEAEERFEKAFQSSPMFIIITERDTGRILEVNDTLLEHFHQKRQHWQGLDSLSSGFWLDEKQRTQVIDKLRQDGRIRNHEHVIHLQGHPQMDLLLNMDVIELNGKSCILTVAQNITQWKLIQRQKEEAIEREQRTREEFTRLLIQREEQEKRGIAGALHDSIGQDLLLVKNRMHLLQNAAGDNEHLLSQISNVNDLIMHAIAEVRRISHDLRPYQLDHLGLKKALEAMLELAARSGTITLTWSIAEVDDLFDGDAASNLYRIIQECLNNIMKHSGAKSAAVSLKKLPTGIEVEVSDDGHGFDPAALDGTRRGMGIGSMSERTHILGGNLVVESAPGQGTRILVRIPLNGQR